MSGQGARLAILLLALAAVCGCSGSKPASRGAAGGLPVPAPAAAAAAISNPCKLLSAAEASAAIGERLGAGELTHPAPQFPRCRFFAANQDELYIDVSDPQLWDGFALGATPLPGIGDRAVWSHNQFGSWIHIARHGSLITLGLPSSIVAMTPALEKAARLIASRM